MADEVVITWSPTNWITIVLMCAVGFLILGTVSKFIRAKAGGA